ncbi:MAG: sigma-54 dependent transcriptional regulator [candidate division Zixibacteria bacterium]|nr:sigma-54 dependent transcriptional regulator [candidate division Zixibacteria bacterium]
MARILVIDDEPKMTSLVCGELEDAGHAVTTSTKPADALALIDKHSFDVVITDLSMPEISGMNILDKALEKPGTDVIIMTAYGTVESAVSAMKKGAADYLLKPFSLDEMRLIVEKLVERQRLASLNKHYEEAERGRLAESFIGSSPAAQRVKKLIAQVAPTETTVLLTGRSGTGKELAARMIHDLSPRHAQPFIAVNCAAITETLLESELFGHEKGSFTGAVGRKRGRFELADGGTIFLDEIGEMSAGMQSKLLRVLEERSLVRVGGVDAVGINVRVVAATNRNLKDDLKTGAFREDLYFRLNVFPINMPNLAEREDDVLELAEYFLARQRYPASRLDEPVRKLFREYDWPGNIRELRNVLERATILAEGEPLTPDEFTLDIDNAPIGSGAPHREHATGLEATEKAMIQAALDKAGGNKTEAAKLLKISRRRLYSRMKAHEIPW